MKNLAKLVSVLLLAVGLFSCKREISEYTYKGGTAPALVADRTTNNVQMSYATQDNEALTITWTNPAYQFSTGLNSQDVNYLVEIDTTGSNFSNPNRKQIGISKDLSLSFAQSVLNDYLLNTIGLAPSVPHNIEIRITSTLVNNSVPLVSNVLKFVITPYAIPPKVAAPTTGHLYLVGSATAGGWNNPVPIPTQEFTKISPTEYVITVSLLGGQQYLFIPLNGDWTHKYACVAASTVATGGDFGFDFSDNFPGPTAGGNYKIDVDFQRGRFTVTPQ